MTETLNVIPTVLLEPFPICDTETLQEDLLSVLRPYIHSPCASHLLLASDLTLPIIIDGKWTIATSQPGAAHWSNVFYRRSIGWDPWFLLSPLEDPITGVGWVIRAVSQSTGTSDSRPCFLAQCLITVTKITLIFCIRWCGNHFLLKWCCGSSQVSFHRQSFSP